VTGDIGLAPRKSLKVRPLPEVTAAAQYAWREGWFQGLVVGVVIGIALGLMLFVKR